MSIVRLTVVLQEASTLPDQRICLDFARSAKRSAESNLIAHIEGPLEHLAKFRGSDVSHLKVMGYPLVNVCNAELLQAATTEAAASSSGAAVLASELESAATSAAASKPAWPWSRGRSAVSQEEKAEVSEVAPEFVGALAGARFPMVAKMLRLVPNPQAVLTDVQLERMQRLDGWFRESVGLFELNEDWVQGTCPEFNFRFGCKVSDESFHTFMSADFEGSDIAKAVAALGQLDLSISFNRELESAELLMDQDPADQVWRVQSSYSELGMKMDNIVQVGIMDCLDEAKCLLVCCLTPDESLSTLRGVTLPPPEKGFARVGGVRFLHRIKPLRKAGTTSQLWGYNITSVSSIRLQRIAYNFLWMMPTWGLARVYRKMIEDFPENFKKHLAESQELIDRMRSESNVQLYSRLQHRVVDTLFRVEEASGSAVLNNDSAASGTLPLKPNSVWT
jgi:hypothetical protein